jgi:type IV pilus assembly protein PilV
MAMERPTKHHGQRGISLVEALVALVVMSVGMLGIASLYVTSLKTGKSALTRTQAVNLVNDMADRIRANARARAAYAYDSSKPGSTPPTAQACAEQNCAPDAIAQNDLALWINALGQTLPPRSVGTVQFTPAAEGLGFPDQYQINVSWNEPGDERPLNYGLAVQLIPVLP